MLASIPNPFDPAQLVDGIIEGLFRALAKASASLLGAMLGWFGRVTEADLGRPWALDVYGRVLAVVGGVGVLLLIISATAGAVRRGPVGAAAPLGRLLLAGFWIGMVRVLVGVMQEVADQLTRWLAPDFQGDVEKIMAAMTAWPNVVPPAGLLLWLLLSLLAFVACLIIAVQLFIRKYAILILWALAPLVGIGAIVDRGLDLLRRHTLTLVAVIMAKPLMAFCISLIAAPLADSGGATIDEGLAATAGLGVAAFAPWLLLAAIFSFVGAAVGRASTAGMPVETAGKVVHGATHPRETVQAIRKRYDDHTSSQKANRSDWDHNRPRVAATAAKAGTAAAAAGPAAPAAAGAVLAAGGARAAGGAASGVVTKGAQQVRVAAGQVSREFGERSGLLVADRAGAVVEVRVPPTPQPPEGLSGNEQLAWRREHVTGEEPTPAQPPPPRRAPEEKP